MKKLALAVTLCALAGCAQTTELQSQLGMTLDQLRTVSAADLAQAEAKAVAAGDKNGANCWQALAPIPSKPGSAFGIATALEDARIAHQAVAGACGGGGAFLPVPLHAL